ncbi:MULTISPECIES: phosphotransferase [unclassified Blastococcus]|uniref:phosphotransferase n=1 Tax=unclassified Blastococcus TaxID=2619396 RepID=UPI001EF0CAF0|nr:MULTISPECIES: phosphotransferase [unclassified Blastococcus]
MGSVPPWAPERTVDACRAAALVGDRVPELRALPVVPLGAGWDNTVHVLGGSWVARFPRRATALPGFRRELAVLGRITGRLPLPVPAPRWVATDDDPADPWPFSVAPLLPGRELAHAGLGEEARPPAAAALGAFLAALHAPGTLDLLAGVELPVDPLGRGTPGARAAGTRAQLAALGAGGLPVPAGAVGALLDEGERLGAPTGDPVLVHGDLHARHLLVDDGGAAAGVIDWGDVCLADPALDLSLAYAGFRGAARAALLAAYGPVPGEREVRARCLAVRLCAMLARYAAEHGDGALLAESLAGLHRAVG